jgi:hypothetical protein
MAQKGKEEKGLVGLALGYTRNFISLSLFPKNTYICPDFRGSYNIRDHATYLPTSRHTLGTYLVPRYFPRPILYSLQID